jgi:2,4-dienoyl-CoA reductase (NADPH2)
LNLASRVPGKEEFRGLVDWFATMLEQSKVTVRLSTEAVPALLSGFDSVVIATGVRPRDAGIPTAPGAHVLTYGEVLSGRRDPGLRVAIVGAGGIGFDVAEYLVDEGRSTTLDLSEWLAEWGVSNETGPRGGLAEPRPHSPAREVTLLQRKPGKLGRNLGKTTGWIHRATLLARRVRMLGGVHYERIDPAGLHVSFGTERADPTLIEADSVVICAGQDSERALAESLFASGIEVHLIGGADRAVELDAKRAIDQGTRLGGQL